MIWGATFLCSWAWLCRKIRIFNLKIASTASIAHRFHYPISVYWVGVHPAGVSPTNEATADYDMGCYFFVQLGMAVPKN
jgi:hypothetical protein